MAWFADDWFCACVCLAFVPVLVLISPIWTRLKVVIVIVLQSSSFVSVCLGVVLTIVVIVRWENQRAASSSYWSIRSINHETEIKDEDSAERRHMLFNLYVSIFVPSYRVVQPAVWLLCFAHCILFCFRDTMRRIMRGLPSADDMYWRRLLCVHATGLLLGP